MDVAAFTDRAKAVLFDSAINTGAISSLSTNYQFAQFKHVYEGSNFEMKASFVNYKQTLPFILTVLAESRKRQNVLEKEFKDLADRWKTERRASSSTASLAMHPAYQKIIGMGQGAVPFILADLQRGVDHWFWALRAITRENPVSPENRGNLQAMAAAWLEWGRKNGYVS
jgi:hypothetical protein